MKIIWRNLLITGCVLLFLTAPGMSVLADELQEDFIISSAEDPEREVETETSLEMAEDVSDEDISVDENISFKDETDSWKTDEKMVGTGEYIVGDGVTATFDEESGTVEFYSNGGTLWREWRKESGLSTDKIESIRVASGTVLLPENSNEIFSLVYYDYNKGCYTSILKELDLSGFDTSAVTNMRGMFASCSNITNLNLSEFDTSNVTDMSGMFEGCSSLRELDLRSFNTSNVRYMSHMFRLCTKLSSLNLSSFDTSNVSDMSFMFGGYLNSATDGCKELTELDLRNFDTSNVTSMRFMFNGCSKLVSLNLNSFNTSKVIDMQNMFDGCKNLTSVILSNFDTSNVTNMYEMFSYCSSLKSIDLSHFDTSMVKNMRRMFYECNNLESLDLDGFNTLMAEDMGEMFYGCNRLTSLELSDFNTSQVVKMDCMFKNCKSIVNLNLKNFDTSKVTTMKEMFSGCNNLSKIDLSNFDTSNVLDMYGMFQKCSNLLSIDLSRFITSNVRDMSYMFGGYFYGDYDGCSSLTELDVSSFDTSNVEKMTGMFMGCRSLVVLDLSNFNTSNVKTMDDMFRCCSNLANLDIVNFNTANVTNMTRMFGYCRSLKKLNLSGFNTTNVEKMEEMFSFCEKIKEMNLKNFDTSKVIRDYGYGMFHGCSGLTSLDLSSFNTSNMTSMKYMFSGCKNLKKLDLINFDTSNVTDMSYMFDGCCNLTELDLSGFDTSKVTSMSAMFKGCSNLLILELESFNTSSVENMSDMFNSCSELVQLNVSSFDTSKVIYFGGMFQGCSSIIELDLSNFIMSKNPGYIINDDMLLECSSLQFLLIPINSNQRIELPYTMYDSNGNKYSELPKESNSIVLAETQTKAQKYEKGGDPGKKSTLTLTNGPIEVKIGGKAAIIACYYDKNGRMSQAPGSIKWGTSSGNGKGKVRIHSVTDYYEYYLCEITGVTEGETIVTAQTIDGRYANVVVNVISAPAKETSENAGAEEHMSGSSNYVLERTKQGVFDIKDGITSGVTIDGASVYTAKNKIVIKSGGELIVTGTLNAADIVVKTGGYLDVDGRLNAGTVTFEGGNWLSQGGFLKGLTSGVIFADNVIFKGKSDTNFDGQIIAKQKFEYKSSEEPSEMSASLYIGGNLKVNDHFTGMQGKIKAIFYGKTSDCKFEVGKKSNLGKVYASSADAFHDTGIGSDNHMGAFQYRNLKKPDDKKWSFTATSTSLERASEKSWANGLSAVYIDLLKNKQTAVDVSSVLDSSLSADESKMINQIAEAWIATIYAQGPKGLLEIKEAVFDLPFTLNRKSYFLRYELTSYGQYSEIGKISFGKDEKNLKPVGLTAAASIIAFKTQATAYLAERYVQEYYKFVTGNIPKWETDSWVIGKLKRGGVDYVKNYMEKMLFQTLTVSEPQSYKDLAKTLKLGKLMLKGDVGGLWKFAIKEVSGAVSNRSVSKNSPGTAVGLQYLSSVGGSENLSGSSESIDSITDIHLKEALIEILGEDANGEPDFSKQANIERLELGGRYIQSLNGLQRFTNLETLILNNNEIKDVSALRGMASLRYLDISGQEIQDLSPLSGLTDLVVLDVGDNDITSLRPLEALTSLNALDISNNPVTSLEGLGEMTGLQTLRASGLILSGGLEELSGLNKLQEVYMEGCGLTDLQGLNTNSLRILDVSSNQIENLDPILMAARLEALDISENAICQIPSLAGCVSLKEADISGNMLIEMDGICDAAVLEILNFSACELTNTDMEILGGIPALKTLDISYNSIIDDISAVLAIPTLEKVDVTRTKVSLEGLTDTVEIIKEETQEEEDDKIDISGLTVTLTVTSYTYDGKEKKPAVTVMDGNAKLTVGTDYTVTYLNNINAGTATVKVEGMGNYKGEKTLTFAINKPASSGFSDVQDPKHAYYKAIYWAADEGITKGYPDGTFGINRSCTRGEMIMFLWRYAGKPAPKAVSKSPFKDVAKTHAFFNAILWASQKGITKGYPDGTFGINRNVSRGECMMFLWRLKGKPAPKAVSVSPFKDVPKTHAFYNAILWGYQKKITTGYTSGAKKGTFGINENCTRGAIVTFLYRAR